MTTSIPALLALLHLKSQAFRWATYVWGITDLWWRTPQMLLNLFSCLSLSSFSVRPIGLIMLPFLRTQRAIYYPKSFPILVSGYREQITINLLLDKLNRMSFWYHLSGCSDTKAFLILGHADAWLVHNTLFLHSDMVYIELMSPCCFCAHSWFQGAFSKAQHHPRTSCLVSVLDSPSEYGPFHSSLWISGCGKD